MAAEGELNKMAQRKTILIINYDPFLLATVRAVLEHFGYAVSSAIGFQSALALVRGASFDLLLLSHTVPRRDRRVLMACVRERGSAPVLMACSQPGEEPDADREADVLHGPKELVTAVEALLPSSTEANTECFTKGMA
jgi:DNA-binding response OmpR family regulator